MSLPRLTDTTKGGSIEDVATTGVTNVREGGENTIEESICLAVGLLQDTNRFVQN